MDYLFYCTALVWIWHEREVRTHIINAGYLR
jgi:hypothetical protein